MNEKLLSTHQIIYFGIRENNRIKENYFTVNLRIKIF